MAIGKTIELSRFKNGTMDSSVSTPKLTSSTPHQAKGWTLNRRQAAPYQRQPAPAGHERPSGLNWSPSMGSPTRMSRTSVWGGA